MKIFKDRVSAGKLLAKYLKKYEGQKNTIVLGIPRGGVVVAHEIARTLKLPLDIIVTRKIGAPMQPELALGAVNSDGEVVWDHDLIDQLDPPAGGLKLKIEDERNEIKRREEVYRQGKLPLHVLNKTVILTDDGIATGATTISAIRYLKKHQASKIVLAVPVASIEAIEKINRELEEVIVLETPPNFASVGQFYYQFEPVTDQEVIQLLS